MRSRYFAALVGCFGALAAQAQVTINPVGGTGPGTGIRITVGGSGQLQVWRNGTGQFYSPTVNPGATTTSGISTGLSNGVYLAVGSNVFGPAHFAFQAQTDAGVVAQEFTRISNTVTPAPDGSGTAVTVLRGVVGGRNYDVTVRYAYSFPNDFVTVTHTLTVPSGNTQLVKLYHALDAYLGGNDFGPSFYSPGPPTIVGAYRPAANIVEAWRYRSGLAWTGYYAGFYECMFRSELCAGIENNSIGAALPFNNYVQTVEEDNGFGIMWNLGTLPGTFSSTNDLTFFSYQPQLSKAFGTTAIQAGASTSLTFTVDNVPGALPQANLGFTDTLPANLVLLSGAVTNTCGGSVTTASGGALAAGSTSVRLAGGSMAGATSRCTVTVTVTSNQPGAYVNGPSNISGLSVLESQVTPQTLSVVTSAPVVSLTPPGVINGTNASTYPVSGTCQDSAGQVTVSVGSVTVTTACTSGAFSATLNVSALPDSMSVQVRAAQTNAGNVTGQDLETTRKDTVSPTAPTITAPSNGSTTNDATPAISGTAEAGTTVKVFAGPTEVCTALVSGTGTWSCVTAALPDGTTQLTPTATDTAGNTSPVGPGVTITVDTTAPAAPVITSPAANAQVGVNPAVSGRSEAGAFVTVTNVVTSSVLCTATADATGQWSCATNLSPGSYTVTATQRDPAGNTSGSTAQRPFTVAGVPSVTLAAPAPITAANAGAYTVSGTCTASAGQVTVRVGSAADSVACAAGMFSVTLNVNAVPDGAAVAVSASQTNPSGTGGDTRDTTKDTVVPTAPTISTPPEGSFTNSRTPTISGSAEPGTTVTVLRGTVSLCTAVTASNGRFSCISSSLPVGQVAIVARAADSVGNTSPDSAVRTFTVDTGAPGAPVIASPVDGAMVAAGPTLSGTAEPFAAVSVFEGSALVCSVNADSSGAWTCATTLGNGTRVLTASQRDRAGNTSVLSAPHTLVVVGLPTVDLSPPGVINRQNQGAYAVSGSCTTTAGQVSISVGSAMTTAPCAGGMFSASVDVAAVADGAVTVSAAQTNASGTATSTRNTPKDTRAPNAPTFSSPAEGSFTSDATPTLTGTAEPGTIVRVTVGGTTVCSTVTPASGQWSCVVPNPLPDGLVSAIAVATDAAGNASPQSPPRSFTVDRVAPMAPVISNPSEGANVGLSPMLSGSAEPFGSVTVMEGSITVCTVTANGAGQWSCATNLGMGVHTVTATQTDRAGNRSPPTAPRTFTVQNVPTVILTAPEPVNQARAPMYRVSGFCASSAGLVTVSVGAVMTTTPCTDGMFSTTLDVTQVPDGATVVVRASQTTAGGVGQDEEVTLKDTIPPGPPTLRTPQEAVGTTNRPTISGSAEPNSTVTIFINDQPVGTAMADGQGNFTFVPPTPLAEGAYTVKAQAADPVGNVGPMSGGRRFGVDSVAPAAPIITSPKEDETVPQDRPLVVDGTSEPGSVVTLYVDGRAHPQTALTDANGRFRFTLPALSFMAGEHLLAADARDAAGNLSPRSRDVRFFVEAVDARFAGQGLIGCTSAGAAPLAWALLALALRRRRGGAR